MAERNSEYARMPADDYATPAWVTDALLSVEIFDGPIWECAPGAGYMVRALEAQRRTVIANDLDFFECQLPRAGHIITNPPYALATEFCRHALDLMREIDGKFAMLLPIAFDAAKTRAHLFADCPAFKAKYVLTKRIRWANLEQKAAGPSMNHAWFVWDWKHKGSPTLDWLPKVAA